jgi:Uma2 family endonuclease
MFEMSSLPTAQLTEEQYLEIERASETKSEFRDGYMFAMAGALPAHSLLANRVGALLDGHMPPGCRVFNSDLRIKLPEAGLYTYPDCSVICGPLEYFSDKRDVVINPLLIVEVLSPSTEGYDRGEKFAWYRTIPSFREYLLIDQERPHVEHYSKRDDGDWYLRDCFGLESAVTIPRWNVLIPPADLYAPVLDLW